MSAPINSPHERIIVPLDVSTSDEAMRIVEDLDEHVGGFKIGYQLGYSIGWQHACELVGVGDTKVFIDPKLNDIPNTIKHAAKALAQFDPWMINVHASSGVDGIRAAVDNCPDALVLVVTVLTSLDDGSVNNGQTCQHVFNNFPQDMVDRFAQDALAAGAAGLICSPKELEALSQVPTFEQLLKVTPGIRPEWAQANDQKRVMTPGEAVKLGADYLVIGRPITEPPAEIGSRIDAAKRIADEIAAAA